MNATRERVFSDPIYGYIRVEKDFIKQLIDSKYFQRLRRIKQLSGVTMVFHTAEHSRFSHSMGAYEIARRFLEIPGIENTLTIREKDLFLASALLHDIGHGPYSHAFEKVFYTNHEKIGANIILNDPEISQILATIDETFAEDVASILLKQNKFPLIEQLISSQLDVDRLDYLIRDSYYTGVPYGNVDIDKIIRSITVVNNQIVYKASALHTLESFFFNRYHMYWQVYYHPVGRSYEFNLEKIYLRVKDLLIEKYNFDTNVSALVKAMKNPNDISSYFSIDDFYINGLINSFTKTSDEILRNLSIDFLNRKIWSFTDSSNDEKIEQILKQFTPLEAKYYSGITAVRQSIYQISLYDAGRELLIEDNGKIVKLSEKSEIIKNLINQRQKTDDKFFYRA